MKRLGHIFDKICSLENLLDAHRNARKDKSYYKEVRMVDRDPVFYMSQIREMLINGTYQVSQYSIEVITDSGKERTLMKLPYYPDRVIQWAIMLQIKSVFHRVFTNFSCASVEGKGIHWASRLTDKYLKKDPEGTKYCLKIDIRHFYPSVNHDTLKQLLRRKFKDPKLLDLMDQIVDSVSGPTGIPIGSYLSQYFANYYLTYFDHWLKENLGIEYVVRYADDITIYAKDKETLRRYKELIDEYLKDNLQLELKGNWQIFPVGARGVDFVGYRHYHNKKILRKRTYKAMKKSLVKLYKKCCKGVMMNLREWSMINSYLGWIKWCSNKILIRRYFKPLLLYSELYYVFKVKGVCL